MTDTDKRNDPDVVVRIRHITNTAVSLTPWVRDLLTEAADTIAELRAELAAERGEAEGALPGWASNVEGLWALGRIAEADREGLDGWRWYVGRDVRHYSGIVSRGVERTARAAMRVAEAEARRLGLLKDDP